MTGWESTERVLDSGGFESRQRVVVPEPMVEASEAGARTLGVTYWQAVDRFTRGGVRASWSGGGGKLKLLGGATLLTFGPPELSHDGDVVSCRARDPRRSARAPRRRLGDPRAAARGGTARAERHGGGVPAAARCPRGRSPLDGLALPQGPEPLPCRRQPTLLRPARREPAVKVTVFGATGVVGRALLPLLAEHEVTAVSRTPRDDAGARSVVADAATGEGVAEALAGADVAYYLVHSLGSRDFEQQDRTAAETVAGDAAVAGVRQIVYLEVSAPTGRPRRTCAAGARRASDSPLRVCR